MTIYFSLAEMGFYDTDLNYTSYPNDIIEISNEMYQHIITETYTNNKELIVLNGDLVLVDKKHNTTWDEVRIKRNKLLLESDYTQMVDYPGNKQAWANYRQALRDISKMVDDPNEVIWPTIPTETKQIDKYI